VSFAVAKPKNADAYARAQLSDAMTVSFVRYFARCGPRHRGIDKEVAKVVTKPTVLSAFTGFLSQTLTEVVDVAGPPIVHRLAFANALWRSTALTGHAIRKRIP
jgi:hypothetical protein